MRHNIRALILATICLPGQLSACRQADVAVLYAGDDPPEFKIDCPLGACDHISVAELSCPERSSAYSTVIVSGHSDPPTYLDLDAAALAGTIACIEPTLIVLDTCHGLSAPLLHALAERLPGVLVIGSPEKLWVEGLKYGPGFFTATTAEARSRHVSPRRGEALHRWHLSVAELDAMETRVLGWPTARLRENLASISPNLVRVASSDDSLTILFLVGPERFK